MKENYTRENRKIFRVNKDKKPLNYEPQNLTSDYYFMKDKFENRPFNIISNKERNINYQV